MKTRFAVIGLAMAWLTLPGVRPHAQAGTWSTLANPAPDSIAHVMLLSDGTVLASQYQQSIGSNWFRLTPDSFGNYLNGTWTNIAPMHYTRMFFASAVLKDGRIFVAGGEYGNGGATAEIYNPLSNAWTVVSPPASVLDPTQTSPGTSQAQSIGDAECKVLPNGQVLIFPALPKTANGKLLYDPVANSWTAGPPTLNLVDEASAVKLPDGSILVVDADKSSTERYLPALNIWTNDTSTSPAYLWASLSPFVGEQGPSFLLPDGRAIVFGGSGQTALYTPSGGNGPGVWVAGPNMPTNQVATDTAGAMMANGNILLALAPPPYVTNGTVAFPGPLSFYEYNYSVGTTGAFTQVFGLTANLGSFLTMMLDLPNGAVLFGVLGNTLAYQYTPSGPPLAAGKPVISTISTNGDGSYHLTGKLFNGISEGAAYGDDHQMDSNFPLVRFIDVSGHVRYGRTYNWSSTGVMTGSASVSTECMPPAGSSITDTIQVVANGIASDGVSLLVTTTADSGSGSLRQVAGVLQGGGTVTFASNLSGQTITLTSGEIAINNNLTIDASALPNGIIINGNHNSRIFNIGGGAAVTLNALVLTNGYSTNGNWGGAIFNAGTMALNYCTFAGNSADFAGGAIANQGPLTVLGCMFSGNSASFSGAIDNRSTCTLKNSTFYGNVAFAGNGGAIDNPYGAVLSVLQCTFSGNSASSIGGAIDNYQAQLNVTNSILSGNFGQDIYNVSGSTLDAGGANIISALANAGTLVGGGTISSANPLLGAPANNGGRTLTMMPQSTSPAINAGVTSLAAGLAYDQRGPGYPRVVSGVVDIGAFEYEAPVITSPSSVTFLTGLSNTFTLTATGEVAPTISVAGAFPPGVGFTPPATLSGTPPDGSGGAYALTVTASNGISPNATQNLTVNVVERSVFAAHPNFNTNGLGWALNGDTVNGGPVITNNLFTITDGASGEIRSAWFRYPLYVGAFQASFTYQDIGGNGADGVGFALQNDPRGPTALGLGGGGLAYAGITSSVATLLNIYSGAPGGPSGLMLGTNGVDAYYGNGALSGRTYQSTAPVNLDAGNPIAVALHYTSGILHISLTDTVTSANFQTNIPVNVPAFTGTNVAWVGITGDEGGVLSHQTVSNFTYVPLPTLLSGLGSSNSVALSWPASIYGYHLQSTSNLVGNVWADLPATVTPTNGFNLATVPATGNARFFRLVLPPQ